MTDRSVPLLLIESSDGFTLIEALAAVVFVAVAAASVAQVVILSAHANGAAGRAAIAQQIAREKIEQLRGLTWSADGAAPVSDWSSDVSVTPVSPSGGSGLGASPVGTLVSNVSGYCDFVSSEGRWLAGGNRTPAGAAWIRRWSIEPISGLADTLLLQVVVVPAQNGSDPSGVAAMKGQSGARLLSIRTRTAR